MATLARTNSRPSYKEYVNFIQGYNNKKGTGQNDFNSDQKSVKSSDSGISITSHNPLSNSNSTSSSSIASIDVVDHKPVMKRTEMYIEIQNNGHNSSVSEVSKIFENQPIKKTQIITEEENKRPINNTIKMFENQISKEDNKKPPVNKNQKSVMIQRLAHQFKSEEEKRPQIHTQKSSKGSLITQLENQLKSNNSETHIGEINNKPTVIVNNNSFGTLPTSPPPAVKLSAVPPPPPMMSPTYSKPKIVPNNNSNKAQVDKNDPAVKKLVYDTLRTMYGNYHGKANEYVATLPEMMVKKDNNHIQNIVNNLESTGDLVKLNGRVNPNKED